MRVRQSFIVVLLMIGGLAATAGNARAAAINDANVFSLQTVASSSYYLNMSVFITTNAVNGDSAAFILSDPGIDPSQLLQIRGFNSAINTLRFYSWGPSSDRASASVSIYYSSALNDAEADRLNPAKYTYLKTAALATLASDPNSLYAAASTDGYRYSDAANLGIPTGTQSVLLKFGPEVSTANGAAMNEVQAFTAPRLDDQNLLLGKSVLASSTYSGSFLASQATDGTGAQHIFGDRDTNEQIVVHGFDSGVNLVRLWHGGDRLAQQVTIKSSATDVTAIADWNTADALFGTTLATLSSITWDPAGYVDISVNAPVGTKSLYFNFGDRTEYGGPGTENGTGVQTLEIQAFGVPEPSTLVILACALIGLLAHAWRKRR